MEASLEEIQNEAVEVLKKLTRAEAVVASKKARAAETSKEEMKQYRHRRKRGFAVLRKETAEREREKTVRWVQPAHRQVKLQCITACPR